MIFSPVRREATPASARNFCRRTISVRNAERRARSRMRVVPVHSTLCTPHSAIGSGFRFGFAQTGDTVALLPLAPFLEQGNPLKTLEHIAFGADGADGAQARML